MTGGRLIVGDARELLLDIPDKSVHLIFTDPPYGIEWQADGLYHSRLTETNQHNRAFRGVDSAQGHANDTPDEADALFRYLLDHAKRILVPGGIIAVCCGGGGSAKRCQYELWTTWMREALTFWQCVIWDKRLPGLGIHWRRAYEMILLARAPGPRAGERWFDEAGRKREIGVTNIIRHIQIAGNNLNSHPCEKPTALAGFFITLLTQKGETVLDPFAGSGSTLVAAKNLGRDFIGFEIDERYAALANQRLRQEMLLYPIMERTAP